MVQLCQVAVAVTQAQGSGPLAASTAASPTFDRQGTRAVDRLKPTT